MEVRVEAKMKNKLIFYIIIIAFIFLVVLPKFVFAGVGLKWDQQSALIDEGKKTCLSYSVYNPWPTDTNIKVDLSENLKSILIMQESETKFVPAYTSSNESIPIKFCFKAPKVYKKDCLIGNLLCEQKCNEEMKEYNGEVIASSVPFAAPSGGSGGSATRMVVGAPLSIRIKCIPSSRDFTLIYILIAVISVLVIALLLYKKYRKPSLERDKEKLKALKEKIRKEILKDKSKKKR
ncbi:MAG: hypothetical protein QXW97_01785 [Candidatus Pacearchaeota archaeon]